MQSAREKQLDKMLGEANEIIRGFGAVCDRKGGMTNWEGLTMQVRRILADQHRFMHPDQYSNGPRDG